MALAAKQRLGTTALTVALCAACAGPVISSARPSEGAFGFWMGMTLAPFSLYSVNVSADGLVCAVHASTVKTADKKFLKEAFGSVRAQLETEHGAPSSSSEPDPDVVKSVYWDDEKQLRGLPAERR